MFLFFGVASTEALGSFFSVLAITIDQIFEKSLYTAELLKCRKKLAMRPVLKRDEYVVIQLFHRSARLEAVISKVLDFGS